MRDAVRHFIAEFVGIFALVFVGSGAIMSLLHGPGDTIWVGMYGGPVLAWHGRSWQDLAPGTALLTGLTVPRGRKK